MKNPDRIQASTKGSIKDIITTILLFVLAFGITSLGQTQVIGMDQYILNVVFLSIVIVLLGYFYHQTLAVVMQDTKKHERLLPLFSLLLHGIVIYLCLNYLGQPDGPFENYGASFLLVNDFFVRVKPLDVAVQQLLLIILIVTLSQQGLTLKQITRGCFIGFGAIHIFQIFKTDLIVGLGFTFFALVGSLLYPRMILKVRNGYLYNYMIHMLVYSLAALLTRWIF